VRHENHRHAAALQFLDASQAPSLELGIADGENFVHDQDVGFQVRRNGKPEPDVHPR
jgi:hypothetical protein